MLSQKGMVRKSKAELPPNNFFKFLGTAGARFVVARQLRASGGTFLEFYGKKMILDPGPGALVRLVHSRPAIDPTSLEAIFLTHKHIDHSNDVNILIDAMTAGGFNKRGVLFAPQECVEGPDSVVFNYLKGYLKQIEILKPEREYHLGMLKIKTSPAHHHEAETYGLKFYLPEGTVGFLVDTKFFPQLISAYAEVDFLVINLVRFTAGDDDHIMHLNVEDASKIIAGVKPKRAYITHFGMTMLRADPRKVAERLSQETGVEVMAAYDGLTVSLIQPGGK
jgi:phosphoribosyl 1,2-cyclic phosphodiesterase